MKKLNEIMSDLKVDAILLSDEANMRYLTGFCGEGMIVAIKDDKFYIFTDSRYTQSATEETKDMDCQIITVSNSSSIIKEMCILIEKNNIKAVAVEGEYLYYAEYVRIKNELKSVDVIKDVQSSIDHLRMIKTKDEIEKIRIAESIGDKAFTHVCSVLKEGMTELMVAAQIEFALKENGAEKLSFDTIVASGLNGDKPHAVPSEKIIRKGELITMDFGCKYKGYCSDMTRTVGLGNLSDRQKEVYNVVKKAQKAGFDAISKGVRGCDVDAVARNVIKDAGFGEYFGHGLGHSLGLKIHESPNFSPRCDTIIEPNMLMTVEPGIYIPQELGVRIEDLVLITENGYEILSHSNRELIEIGN